MKTFSAKPVDIDRKWHTLDASGKSLGRLAANAAQLLIGKSKSNYTPHMDGGDFVIIVNASEVKITGNKAASKKYYRHSGFPGGIRSKTYSEIYAENPTLAIQKAIRGMLPVNKLREPRLKRLKVYSSNKHQHQAQTSEFNSEVKK